MTSLLPFTTDIIRAFGWTLLHSFWQAFFVFACLRIVLRIWPMASAAIKYHLSFLSLAGIAGWFLVTFYNQLDAIKEAQKIQDMALTWDPATIAAAMEHLPQQSNGLQTMLPGMESYFPFLVAIYIVGVTLMTIKLCLDLAQLRQMRQEGISAMGATWDGHLLRLADSMGVTRKVQLFISQHLQVPVMIGFLKPVILLPVAMVSNLSPEQLEAILLHELAHIKRNDYLLNIFQSIVETILFFNPFVWWISKNIRLEREHCCDDLVIAGTVQPLHYARALVALEEYRLTANPMAMAAADDKHHLLHRIKRIMEMKTKNLNYSQRVLALLIIVVGLVSIAWLNPGNKSEKKEKKALTEMATDTIPMPPPAPPAPVAPPAVKEIPAPAALPAPVAPVAPPAPAAPSAPVPAPAFQSLAPMAAPAPMPAMSLNMQLAPIVSVPTVSQLAPMAPMTYSAYATYNTFYADGDTTTPRAKKIIIKGEDGTEKAYNSIAEMPEADRKKMEENYIRMQQQYGDAHRFNYNYNYNLHNDKDIQEAMKKAQEAMKKIDWSKMGKDIEANMKKVDWSKLNKDMQENIKKMNRANFKMDDIQFKKLQEEIKINFEKIDKADWDKINKQIQENLKKIDWEKLEKDIKKSSENHFQEGAFNAKEEKERTLFSKNEGLREAARARANASRDIAEQRAQAGRIQRDEVNRERNEQRATASKLQAEIRAAQDQRRSEISKVQAEQRAEMAEKRKVASEIRQKESEARRKAMDEMLDGMQKDNLLDREKDFEIEKKEGELFINGKKQPDEVNKKYEQYLKNKNVTIKKSKDSFHMNSKDNR